MCQWRLLPSGFPYWQLSYYYFWKWRNNGTWETINQALVELRRKKAKQEASPSVALIDSQSVKSSEWGVPSKGYDGYKKVKGRKRHIVVDTFGLVLLAVVGAANEQDGRAARRVFPRLAALKYTRLSKVLADSADGKKLAKWVKKTYQLVVEVVKVKNLPGFTVIPMRWKVERTFAWLNGDSRLSKDYQCNCSSAESFIYISNMHRILPHF